MKKILVVALIVIFFVSLHEIPKDITEILVSNNAIINGINSINIDYVNVANGQVESLVIEGFQNINNVYSKLSKLKVKKVYKLLHGNYKRCAKKQYYTGYLNFTVREDKFSNLYLIVYKNKTENVYTFLDDLDLDTFRNLIEND